MHYSIYYKAGNFELEVKFFYNEKEEVAYLKEIYLPWGKDNIPLYDLLSDFDKEENFAIGIMEYINDNKSKWNT